MGYGPGEFLQLIRSGKARTRGELLAESGLSRVTVAQRIDALRQAGLIRAAGDAGATGGRRATTFLFDPQAIFAVASVDLVSARLALANAHGELLTVKQIGVKISQGPVVALTAIATSLRDLLAAHGYEESQVAAIGLSVPGPIDPESQRLVEPPTMPGWGGWPLQETIRDVIDVPVYVENDADAMAYGEWGQDTAEQHRPFLLVKVSEYIGGGIVINDQIYRGYDGAAGDIGHVFAGGKHLCRCGRIGCLATEASGTAVRTRLQEYGLQVDDLADVCRLVEEGHPQAAKEIRHAGELLGRVLGTVVSVLNPATLVISGAAASTTLVAAVRTAVYASTLPRATRHLDIRLGQLGPDSALVGLVRVAVKDMYSPTKVDQRLGLAS